VSQLALAGNEMSLHSIYLTYTPVLIESVLMPDQSKLEKDIAALRSHVIDGIEDVKASAYRIETNID
jgi:hypothetical protein